jgi:hypothetical protein
MTDEIKLPPVDLTQLKRGCEVWVKGHVDNFLDNPYWSDKFFMSIKGEGKTYLIPKTQIVRIFPPPETDAEKIALLEAEVRRLKQEVGRCSPPPTDLVPQHNPERSPARVKSSLRCRACGVDLTDAIGLNCLDIGCFDPDCPSADFGNRIRGHHD